MENTELSPLECSVEHHGWRREGHVPFLPSMSSALVLETMCGCGFPRFILLVVPPM